MSANRVCLNFAAYYNNDYEDYDINDALGAASNGDANNIIIVPNRNMGTNQLAGSREIGATAGNNKKTLFRALFRAAGAIYPPNLTRADVANFPVNPTNNDIIDG